jgi:hypothetical protein
VGVKGLCLAGPPRSGETSRHDYEKTHFGNGRRSPLVTGNAPVTDQVLQIS